jgi:hypothetical protein
MRLIALAATAMLLVMTLPALTAQRQQVVFEEFSNVG